MHCKHCKLTQPIISSATHTTPASSVRIANSSSCAPTHPCHSLSLETHIVCAIIAQSFCSPAPCGSGPHITGMSCTWVHCFIGCVVVGVLNSRIPTNAIMI
jgi:hypothetical protein